MATRHTLDDAYRGGRVNDEPVTPRKRLRYPCFAIGCPMPGTIFPGGSTEQSGTCAWHYGVNPDDIPRVSGVLRDWGCVAYEVDEARRVLTGESASDPGAVAKLFQAANERLRPSMAAGGWGDELEAGKGEDYGAWARRCEAFLGARVTEVLSLRQRRAA
jgi:hypothetical protein